MSNYNNNKTSNNFNNLKNNFDLLCFKELIKNSMFIIYFNSNKLSNKSLYNFKNEILKKNLKSAVICSTHIKGVFEGSFQFFNSNTFFVFCNNISNFLFVANLLNNTKFLYFYNKCFNNNVFNNNLIANNNLIFLHFIIFKLLFNIQIILLFYIINFIKNIKNTFI